MNVQVILVVVLSILAALGVAALFLFSFLR